MTRQHPRRESLLRSLNNTERGGFTTYAADLMATPLGGEVAECTITRHCRTSIFQFPTAYSKEPVASQIVYAQGGLRAAIVSDLPAYFEETPPSWPHYSIDVSLRAGVASTYESALQQAGRQTHPHVPLFVAVDECERVSPTILKSGECFTIDEFRDGREIIEGGRRLERALLAVKTIDGSWPDFFVHPHAVNIVLTAVKVEQNVTDHIDELYSCSCFVSSEGQCVYTLNPNYEHCQSAGETLSRGEGY